jgi:hypothetical protein
MNCYLPVPPGSIATQVIILQEAKPMAQQVQVGAFRCFLFCPFWFLARILVHIVNIQDQLKIKFSSCGYTLYLTRILGSAGRTVDFVLKLAFGVVRLQDRIGEILFESIGILFGIPGFEPRHTRYSTAFLFVITTRYSEQLLNHG